MALDNTYRTLWIRAERKSRMAKIGQLLGFARATSDTALSATIWDVSVSVNLCRACGSWEHLVVVNNAMGVITPRKQQSMCDITALKQRFSC